MRSDVMLNIGCHLLISKGLEAITKIINHPLLRDLPFNLETPNDIEGHGKEIELLRGKYK
jgi:deoxyribonuclease-4